jgi:hypothetical protein
MFGQIFIILITNFRSLLIRKLAVQQDGYAIRFIKEPSEEIQKLAVQQRNKTL